MTIRTLLHITQRPTVDTTAAVGTPWPKQPHNRRSEGEQRLGHGGERDDGRTDLPRPPGLGRDNAQK
jgi:hypothetical protein